MKKHTPFLFVFLSTILFVQACGNSSTPTPAPTDIPAPTAEVVNPVENHLDLAVQYADSGEAEQEIAEYIAALELEPENALIHLLLGNAYQKEELIDQAVSEYKEVKRLAALDPNLTITVPSVADLYYDSGKYAEAIPEYLEAIEENPDNLEDYIALGFCYYQLEEYEKAAAEYEVLLERDPEYAIGLFGLGSIYYYKLEEYEKALPLLQKYLEIEPETKYREEVERMIADITGITPTKFEGDTRASAVLKNDVLNGILGYLNCDEASEVKIKTIFFEVEDGTEGQVWGKEEWLITACDETKLFAITFTADGEGGTFFNIKEIDAPTDSSGLTAEEHLDLASTYYEAGETDKEIAEYLATIALDPDNVQAHAFLGFTYHVAKGKTEDGIAELEKALAIDANNDSALIFLGFIYYDTKEYEKAIPIFEKFLELYPDDQYKDMVTEMLNEAKNQ